MNRIHLLLLYGLLGFTMSAVAWLYLQKKQPTISLKEESTQAHQTYPRIPLDSVRIFPIPDSLTFAGESVPLHLQDIYERLERELYVNAYWQSNMVLLMKRSGKYLDQMKDLLEKEGIPQDFIYLAMAESGLQNVTSPAGATGFWQFMRGTARDFGLELNNHVDERYHWEKSTQAASRYLKQAYRRFGNWTAVAASYNMGQAGFSKRQTEQLEEDYYQLLLNDETSRYLFRILAFKVIFENPQAYGFNLKKEDLYQDPPLKAVSVSEDISSLATWAKSKGHSYKELKLYNPWLRKGDLPIRKGRSYQILLPAEKN